MQLLVQPVSLEHQGSAGVCTTSTGILDQHKAKRAGYWRSHIYMNVEAVCLLRVTNRELLSVRASPEGVTRLM